MKQIFLSLIMLLSLSLSAQRDSLNYNVLRTYISADTTTIDDEEIEFTFEWYSPELGNVTEIDTFFKEKSSAIDDLIATYQQDSVLYQQAAESFYEMYQKNNTTFINIVRRLAKYWAIKP